MTFPDLLARAETFNGTTDALSDVYREMYDLGLLPSEADDVLRALHTATKKTLRVLREDWKAFCQARDHLASTAHGPHRNGHGAGHSAGDGGSSEPLPYSDYTNALAFVREHGKDVRYCYPWKTWLVWTGTHWQRDTSGAVMQKAKDTIKRLARSVETLSDEQAITALLAHIKSSLSTAKLKAMLESAQSEPPLPTQPEAFDADLWLLNCTNGTLDLRTGTLRAHQQGDLLTKCLPIAYDQDATYPTWQAFLRRIMGGSVGEESPEMSLGELEHRRLLDAQAQPLIDYLQRTAGYTLTGSTREQCIFLCHGPTKTGKSTYLAMMRNLLGPYGKQTDMETFMHKDRPEVRNDLADLAGARYIYAVESQEGKRLAEGLVKQMTGGVDHMKARFLFQEYFEFAPQFKAYIGTNHLPVIKDSDDAIWERIRRIPFTAHIPKDQRNKNLEVDLLCELPGILAWAVQGCLDWQEKNDLCEPEAVVAATQGYRDEMDRVSEFLSECCLIQDAVTAKASALKQVYDTWCKRMQEEPLSKIAFITALEGKGLKRQRGHANQYYWQGVGLVDKGADKEKNDE